MSNEVWKRSLTRAREIWTPSDFHVLELTKKQFDQLLPRLEPVIADFAAAADGCAAQKDREGIGELYRGFADWVPLCSFPSHFSGKIYRGNYDLFKLVGQKMFLSLVAALLRHDFAEALPGEDWGQRYQARLDHSSLFSDYHLLPDDAVGELLSSPELQAAQSYLQPVEANP